MRLSRKLVAITMAGLAVTTPLTPVFAVSDSATAPTNTVAAPQKSPTAAKVASGLPEMVPYATQAEMLKSADEARRPSHNHAE